MVRPLCEMRWRMNRGLQGQGARGTRPGCEFLADSVRYEREPRYGEGQGRARAAGGLDALVERTVSRSNTRRARFGASPRAPRRATEPVSACCAGQALLWRTKRCGRELRAIRAPAAVYGPRAGARVAIAPDSPSVRWRATFPATGRADHLRRAALRGMDPAQMEGFLTYYFEYHFLYITGIEHVESKSIEGAALIKLQFHPGTTCPRQWRRRCNT